MRSHVLSVLHKAQPGQQTVAGVAAGLQGALSSCFGTPSCARALSASAEPVEEAPSAGSDAAADVASAGVQPAPASSSSSSNGSTAAAGDCGSSSSSSRGRQATHGDADGQAAAGMAPMLYDMGVVVPGPQFSALPQHMQVRIKRLHRHAQQLTQLPSGGMAVARIHPHQLQTVVTPARDYGPTGHPLEDAEDWVRTRTAALQKRAQRDSSSSSAGSGVSSVNGKKKQQAAKQQEQPATDQPQQQLQQQAQNGNPAKGTKQQRQRKEQRRREPEGPVLSPDNLLPVSRSELMVNLSTQMDHAAAARSWRSVVNLFDQVMEQGIAAALQQQQQGEQAQQQEGQQQQEPAVSHARLLMVPVGYRPDVAALLLYCKALNRVADKLGAWQSDKAASSAMLQGAQRALQLWGTDRDSGRDSNSRVGPYVHMAYMSACRAAGQYDEVIDHWERLQTRMPLAALKQHWKLHSYVTAAAMLSGDLTRADRYARVFSDNAVAYTQADYIHTIGPLLERLALRTANARLWDPAIYWLQQLINKDALSPVEPASFLALLWSAAKAGRLDLARVMLQALDEQLKLQGKPAYVYSEEQCCSLIQAGAKRGDVPFIELVWERLCRDVKRPGREQETPAGVQSIIASFAGAASSSAAADSADAGAAGTNSGGSSSSSQQSLATAAAAAGGGAATEADPARQASANAHLAVIQALVQCDAFDKAFSYIHDMEQVYGQDPACSVYHGLRFFPESLGTEAKLAAAFAKLQKRKEAEQPITVTMLNVITRAIARLSSVDSVGNVFEAYEPGYGLQPDADTYNAVMEACERTRKVAGVQGVMSHMISRGLSPNTTSWNLLLSTAINAEDTTGVASALKRIHESGIKAAGALFFNAERLATDKGDAKLRGLVRQVAQQALDADHPFFREQWRRERRAAFLRSSSGGHGSGGSGSTEGDAGRRFDRWDKTAGGEAAGSSSSSNGSRSNGSNGGSNGSSSRVDGGMPGKDTWHPGMQELAGRGGSGLPASGRMAGFRAAVLNELKD